MITTVEVLCRPEVAPGFALTGVAVRAVPAGEDVAAAITEASTREETGVLLVEDRLYRSLGEETRRRVDRMTRPVVVPFPSPSWAPGAAAEAYVVELLRRAIGYRVRLS